MFLYIKALHIIFVVTWFAGLFYMPRLFIYNTEAQEKTGEAKEALTQQFSKMMKGLWFGITWPSAILTLILGLTTMYMGGWDKLLFHSEGHWLLVKLFFVLFL
jgi:putative membrane protein